MSASRRQFGQAELEAAARVLDSQLLWRGNGPLWSASSEPGSSAVDRFEDAFAAWLDLPYAHAVNSGTSANEAAVRSLDLPPGSEVICPSASPVFVPMAVLAAGCIPVFVDVDPGTMLLDPELLPAALTDRTRAVVALHLWGHPAPMEAILGFARANGLLVVEDCAQAPASSLGGRRLGGFGDTACFSLQQTKLVTAGEGGVVATADRAAYARAVLYSNTGIPSFRHGISLAELGLEQEGIQSFGHNHRMSELQGAVALAQLARAEELVQGRARAVDFLRSAITELGDARIAPLEPAEGAEVSYWRLPVAVPEGAGDYAGIPPLEPVFLRMERERSTPFGLPLPDYVRYGPGSASRAQAGARRTSVLPVSPFFAEADARRVVREKLQRG